MDEITGNSSSEIPAAPVGGEKPDGNTGESVPPTTLEQVQQALAEVEALKQELKTKTVQTEKERRRNQSEADRARRLTEQANRATQAAMAQLDPDQRTAMEATLYRELVANPQVQSVDPKDTFGPMFEDQGIDPNHPDIDYAYIAEASDQREGVKRLNRVIAQIRQKDVAPAEPKPEAKGSQPKPETPPVEPLRPSGGGAPGRYTTEKVVKERSSMIDLIRQGAPISEIQALAETQRKALLEGKIQEE
jgi:hypothetical protein